MKKTVMKKTVLIAFLLIVAFVISGCSAGGVNNSRSDSAYSPSYDISSETESYNENYQYDEVQESDFTTTDTTDTSKNQSYFSLDRNTASYSMMRRQIESGLKIAANSVRLEEYINYFSYNYERPAEGEDLAISGNIFDCPWNSAHKLFKIGVATEEVTFDDPKPNNIVFLIDTSGSMEGDDRLGLIQQAFTMLTENLNDADTVSIVTYATGVRTALEGARGNEKTRISNVLQDLSAGGTTNGSGGIQLAYEVALKYFVEDGNNRVILATDGDFNVGISNQEELKEFISKKRQSGIFLSVLGVGMINTNDSTMNTLATNGNGTYSYLDSVAEARKVLVEELGGTVNVVAKDAKAGVVFNAETVESYRLLGYETKMMSQEEFNDVNKDAGEIGSGHTVTAVYEIQLKEGAEGTVANVQINYKSPASDPTEDVSKSVSKTFTAEDYTETPDEDSVFLSCVTEYGLLLRQSEYKGDATFADVVNRLNSLQSVTSSEANQFRAEFLEIVKKAAKLYEKAE